MKEKIKLLPKNELRKTVLGFSDHFARALHIENPRFTDLINKSIDILENHGQVMENMRSKKFLDLLAKEREIKGDAKVGYVQCVDGRLQSIFYGRIVNVWEEPASLFEVTEEKGQMVIASEDFKKAVQREAKEKRDLFEIVFAHTSLTTDHVCGYMAGRKKSGEFGQVDTRELVDINLKEIEANQIPALTNTYNEARKTVGKPLEQVAISAVYDTDTMGTIVNYGKDNELSTTALIEKEGFKSMISQALGNATEFGSWREKFTNPENFLEFYTQVVELTSEIVNNGNIGLGDRLRGYIDTNFPSLTSSQKQAFLFSLSRTIAHQYLTGLSTIAGDHHGHPVHPFANHGEKFATISSTGEGVLDRYNTRDQSFGITSSSTEAAIIQARDVALPLLDQFDEDKESHVLFVSTAIGKDDDINDLREKNRQYYEALSSDSAIAERLRAGNLLMVPILVKTTGEIIEIPSHIKD